MQQLPIQCGPVQLSELAAVTALEQAAFKPPVYPNFFFRQAYDLWPNMFWVARGEQGVLGYLIAAPSADNAQELSLLSLAISAIWTTGCQPGNRSWRSASRARLGLFGAPTGRPIFYGLTVGMA